MIRADLIVERIGELATLDRGPIPRLRTALGELGRIPDATLAVDQGRFVFVGARRNARGELRLRPGGRRVDAGGGTVVPGFVDPHTHVLFGGSRHAEVPAKLRGESYAKIAAAGGGLFSTVRATRASTEAQLLESAARRLEGMARHGTTTAEVKTGYELTPDGELTLLRMIPRLAARTGLRLVPTFLGGHAVPPEYRGRGSAYLDLLVERCLPVIASEGLSTTCDVFCEPGFFSVPESERFLSAAQAAGLRVRLHADEFVRSGGAALAARLGAASADHLLATGPSDWRALADAQVPAVLLPVTPFASLFPGRPPGRELVDIGVAVAVGSDLSPNSWVESMPTVLSHAVYSARLTPAESIAASTVNAAHVLGLSDEVGRIRVGLSADFSVFPVRSADEIAYRVGTVPDRVYRQGKPRSSR